MRTRNLEGRNEKHNASSTHTISVGVYRVSASSRGTAGDHDYALAGSFGLGGYSCTAVLLLVCCGIWVPESETHPANRWLSALVRGTEYAVWVRLWGLLFVDL